MHGQPSLSALNSFPTNCSGSISMSSALKRTRIASALVAQRLQAWTRSTRSVTFRLPARSHLPRGMDSSLPRPSGCGLLGKIYSITLKVMGHVLFVGTDRAALYTRFGTAQPSERCRLQLTKTCRLSLLPTHLFTPYWGFPPTFQLMRVTFSSNPFRGALLGPAVITSSSTTRL